MLHHCSRDGEMVGGNIVMQLFKVVMMMMARDIHDIQSKMLHSAPLSMSELLKVGQEVYYNVFTAVQMTVRDDGCLRT